MSSSPRVYSARQVVAYDYRRSVGPVLGHFFTALRDRRIVANRTASGRVLCPPMEHDPETGDATEDGFLEVGPGGAISSWSWVSSPRAKHPLSRPFAWALIRLDGADTSLLHVVDAGSEARLRTGLRVVPRWRGETCGEIGDLECFEPEERA